MIFIPARGLIYIIFHIHQFYPPAWCAGPATDATQRIIGIFPTEDDARVDEVLGCKTSDQHFTTPTRDEVVLGAPCVKKTRIFVADRPVHLCKTQKYFLLWKE